MDLKDQLNLFISRHQSVAWVLILMGGGLLFQGIMWILFSISGQTEMYDSLIKLLVLPPNLKLLLRQPWSIITFPFFHLSFDILNFLVTGLILWAFGRIHQQLMGDQRTRRLLILAVPTIGILTASISSFLPSPQMKEVKNQKEVVVAEKTETEEVATAQDSTQSISEENQEKVDALIEREALRANRYWNPSGMISVIMVLVLSSITLVPAFQVQLFLFGRVQIMWIGVVLLLLELAMAGFVTPAAIAISIGALLGFLHVYLMRREIDITEMIWSYYAESNKPRMTVAYKAQKKDEVREVSSSKSGKKQKKKASVPQETVDKILDKISEKGYESLSREEKEILYKASSQKEDEQD